MLEAAFVRSPHAHAAIRGIDTSAARGCAGVHAVFTLADLAPLLAQERLPLQFRTANLPADITPFALAKDEVAFVGEAVAIVIAQTRYIAEDAAALVAIDYEPLPAVSDCRQALAPQAPRAHATRESNLLIQFQQSYGEVAEAFARAPRRLSVHLKQHRGGAHSIEGRGALAVYDANEERLTLWSSTQLAHEVRAFLMTMLRLDENQLRVVAPDVGGGFGAKFVMYPEEVSLAAACLMLHRPIRWIEDRREHFLAAVQERDQYWDVEVAFDDDGHLLAVRGAMIHDEGAYTPQGINLPYNASTALPGPYMLPAFQLEVRVAETNKVATMPVRGAGYPEGAFAMERLLDRIADELNLDRAEVRRRNLVPVEKMPYVCPLKTRAGSAITLDSGDFPACQRTALEAIDYAGFAERQRRARERGRYLGIGIGNGIKGTGRGPFESGIAHWPFRPRLRLHRRHAHGARDQDCACPNLRRAVRHRAAGCQRRRRRYRRHSPWPGRLRQPSDRDRGLRRASRRGQGARKSARGRRPSFGGRCQRPRAARWPRRDCWRTGQRALAASGCRSGIRGARLCHARPIRAGAREHAELRAESAHLWRRVPCRRGRAGWRDLRRAHPALYRRQRQRSDHQSHDRRGTARRRGCARDRQRDVRMDGLRRCGAAADHYIRRLSDPERNRGPQDRGDIRGVSLPAQSARRQRGGRIRLRARRRRDRLGH